MTDDPQARPRKPGSCHAHFESFEVSLALYGTDLDPPIVSTQLGREPTLARRRGDRPSARAAPAEWGAWVFSIASAPPKLPDEIAGELLDHFPADPQLWARLCREYTVQVRFAFNVRTLTACFELGPVVAQRLATTGAVLAFHFYASGD